MTTANIPYPSGNITLANSYISTGYSSGSFTLATSYGSTWLNSTGSNSSNSGSIQVKGNAEFEGKVTINGQDLAETLQTIQDRLAILIPNPKLLDKYEALKQAYEHYKTLEALCVDENTIRK